MFSPHVISAIGVLGVALVVFAESGLFIGFFLPGDSLLITAGLLAAAGHINIIGLFIMSILAAIVGDSVGYATGRAFGPTIFSREESWLFKKEYVTRAEQFFAKHGSWAIVIARFTPIIRTFIPIMAGVGHMNYRKFLTYNIMGGIAWAGGLTLAAYFAGEYIPGIAGYINYIVIGVVLLSLIPLVIHYRQGKKK